MLILLPQGTSGTVSKGVSDTASLQASEGNTSDFDIETLDSFSFSANDTAVIAINLDRAEFAGLALAESATLQITNPTAIAGTETASLALTDASAVAVTLAVTDTTSLQTTDASTVDIGLLSVNVTDTTSLTASDFAFSAAVPEVTLDSGDAVSIHLEDSATVYDFLPIARIRFTANPDVIRFSSP
jgi:hypothetical protein